MALKDRRGAGGKSRGSSFKYQERDSDAVRKRAEQKGGKFDSILKSGFDSWRPADGENAIRILPPTWDEHDHYGYDIWVHSYVGPDKSTYLCPQKMLNKPCPICKAQREAHNAGEEEDAKQLQATRRVAVWILDRDADRPTPVLWTMSWSQDRDIAALCQNKRTGKVLLIDHPNHGYDILFSRTGKGLNTRYVGLAVDREETAALEDEDELEKVLEYIQENPIPDTLNFYDEAYLANVIEGTAEGKDEDLEDDDSKDRGSRGSASRDRDRGGKSARKPSRRDEDDVEDDVEEDDPPARGKSSRKPSRDDEDDAEDEDRPRGKSARKPSRDVEEDEVEEDDPPPRGGKSARKPSRREEPEDDVEDDVEEDEDRPRGGKSARKPSRRDEPEDDAEEGDAEDDVEEDDPPPRRSSGTARTTSRRR